MIKLSDFVFKFLEEQGVKDAFMLSGGGIMHLVESLGNSNINYVCCHHEQSCSIAAQAYSMVKNNLGVCLVTTGPGGTNALTGAAAAYVDSTPVIFISGQVKRDDFASLRGVRQFGAQENDIISMAKPVTKYAKLVEKPEEILCILQKAVYEAMNGRQGPVWIDIPLDVQAEMIDENNLKEFKPDVENKIEVKDKDIEEIYREIKKSKRPLFLIGHGVVSSNSSAKFIELQRKLKIPTVATWRALDVLDFNDEYFFGSPGLQANRFSNIITQGCDLLIVLGSRLDNMITAYNESHFAFRAKRIIVDIDKNEIEKLDMENKSIYNCDVKDFIDKMLEFVNKNEINTDFSRWLEFCKSMKEKYKLINEKQVQESEFTDLYKLTLGVSDFCQKEDTIVVSSTSRCNTAGHMAFYHKAGQKTISSMGMGSMGFAIPSVVGAYFASNKNRVVCFEGDGSFQLNIQELQTIKYYNMNAKLFIFSNKGYAAIATMQDRNFDSHYVGSTYESGVSMPNLEKISEAYEIQYFKIEKNDEITDTVEKVMKCNGPVICEVIGSIKFDEIPKCISSVNEEGKRVSATLENPFPYLSEKEMEEIYKEIL